MSNTLMRSLAVVMLISAISCVVSLAHLPSKIVAPELNPSTLRPGAFRQARLAVYLAPGISEDAHLKAVNLGDVNITSLRSTLAVGLTKSLRDAFASVALVDSADADADGDLLLRVDELAPQHVKTGNVPLGDAVAYEMRFDVRYRAALMHGEAQLTSVAGLIEGRDLSWRAEDQQLMLRHALEDTIARMTDTLFANEATIRAGDRGTAGFAIRSNAEPNNAVAVMPLRANGMDTKTASVLDDLLVVAVDSTGALSVISTADINAMLTREKIRDAMGCDDVECAAEIGGALGVKYLLTGSVAKLGSKVIVTLHLLDTDSQSSAARSKASVNDDEDLYQQAIEFAVKDLVAAARLH